MTTALKCEEVLIYNLKKKMQFSTSVTKRVQYARGTKIGVAR